MPRRVFRDSLGRYIPAPVMLRDRQGRYVGRAPLPARAAPIRRARDALKPIRPAAKWAREVLQRPARAVARETGIRPQTLKTIRKEKRATRAEMVALRKSYARHSYGKMRRSGIPREVRQSFKGAAPETVAREVEKYRYYGDFIAQLYDRPLSNILKGMSKSKMNAEEFDLYMRSKYPWAFDEEEEQDVTYF